MRDEKREYGPDGSHASVSECDYVGGAKRTDPTGFEPRSLTPFAPRFKSRGCRYSTLAPFAIE
ncbi:hypothetical protein C474_03190 [Halogeometricum pallidum JCM 14848]|uniref:Uncharacterized protein n=1 Tax=Halogeometricum pallidum JCM 14848 TaxID=1227487 RepID=M0DEL5_HALPD|nr:hypothetical protein C474_03190 [Halogeometricum pallidum JCM 14848]